ncbi:TPA: ead/Ea22-like family protein [Enterobacter soli]
MSNIDKQALREAAEKAISEEGGTWWSEELLVHVDGVVLHQADAAFIAAANPSALLALLDELEAAEKRIAEHHGQKRLIGWRMADYTDETADPALAKNWAAAVGVLPIFEGDANTKLSVAMLQGAEPVTTAYKLPDDFDFDRFNDVTWLDAVASNPHMHSLTTSTIAMVALELNKRLEAGNSPVIPDGWVMVPVEPTAEMISSGIAAHYERNQIQIHDRPSLGPIECAYVAMVAAAPKQEAK